MTESMFQVPKFQFNESIKYRRSNRYDNPPPPPPLPPPVPYRHREVSPDFDLTAPRQRHLNQTIASQSNDINTTKCPIYVHDFVKSAQRGRIVKQKPAVSIDQIEETFWASWKPSRHATIAPQLDTMDDKTPPPPPPKMIKKHNSCVASAATSTSRNFIIDGDVIYYKRSGDRKNKKSNDGIKTVSQEIQTDDRIDHVESLVKVSSAIIEKDDVALAAAPIKSETNVLKHTDSFILNSQIKEPNDEHFEQPKCIRLYKKPGYTPSNNYVKGGSYPLRSCLKKEGLIAKGNIRLGPPGCSLIVTSSFSNRFSRNFRK